MRYHLELLSFNKKFIKLQLKQNFVWKTITIKELYEYCMKIARSKPCIGKLTIQANYCNFFIYLPWILFCSLVFSVNPKRIERALYYKSSI